MPLLFFPSWAYNNAGQPALIVLSQAAFNALPPPGMWSFTPFSPPFPTPPADSNAAVTDTRLQQSLIEQRITNLLLLRLMDGSADTVDLQGLRLDVVTQDSSLLT